MGQGKSGGGGSSMASSILDPLHLFMKPDKGGGTPTDPLAGAQQPIPFQPQPMGNWLHLLGQPPQGPPNAA